MKAYIKAMLDEAKLARVPQQLVNDEELEKEKNTEKEEKKVDEFSSAGAIYGYTAPLGSLGTKRRPQE